MRMGMWQLGAPPRTLHAGGSVSIRPGWLNFDASWEDEIKEFSRRNHTDILQHLVNWGKRWSAQENRLQHEAVMWPNDECFVENQPTAEEGFAMEHWVV